VSLDAEMWLAQRIRLHIVGIFDGETEPAIRRDRARAAIKNNGLESVVAGRRGGRPETYAEVFSRLYGEAL
jgi:hypothetical protein